MITFSHEAVTIGGFSIHWYGILIALGFLGGIFIAARREKRYGFPADTALSMALWILPVSIVCARLYYVAFSFDVYRHDLWAILRLREGGLAIYGGVLGGVAVGLVFARRHHLSVPALADLAAPALAFGQAVGRWGNFFNREAFGGAITAPRWQFFPFAVYIEAENGWFAATFFYESLWCALIVVFLLLWEKRCPRLPRGHIAIGYLALYAAERVLVEGLRTDSLYFGPVRVSQLLSAVVLGACLLFLALSWKKSAARRIFVPVAALCAAGLIVCSLSLPTPAWLLPLCDAIALGAALFMLLSARAH